MNGHLISREELSPSDMDGMFDLFRRHFEGASESGFQKDLEDKNWVVRLEDDDGDLAGFSTLRLYRTHYEREPLTVVYSGDTIVELRAWRSSVLARTWIDSVRSLHRRFGEGRLVWLLITSGFRTYRFLPVFWRQFFPRYDRETPEKTRRMMDRLAHQQFGSRFDSSAGIVRFERPQVLTQELRGIPAARMKDPHVAFFARRNPGHVAGDELVCLTDLTDANLTAAGQRMVRDGQQRRVAKVAAS